MASQSVNSTSLPAAHVVGQAFVEQYYNILRFSPEMVHNFYQDNSVIGRPDSCGVMSSVTTMQGINEKVMSLNYGDYQYEIENVDAQDSFQKGVIVLVAGALIGKDDVRRTFTQSFFLAPQERGGYFVLNDIFRYVGEHKTDENSEVQSYHSHDLLAITVTVPPTEETLDPHSDEHVEEGTEVSKRLTDEGSIMEKELVNQPVQPIQHDAPAASKRAVDIEDEVPKMSYASIVKVMKGSSAPSTIYVATVKAKVAPAPTEQEVPPSTPAPAPVVVSTNGIDVREISNHQEDVTAEGHSIYVRNLPSNATPADVEEEFKKFGLIKPRGVQVRNHRLYGYCFGFVEFESETSMQAAIEAGPVTMGSSRVIVESKRTTTRVDGGARSQMPPGRGGFRGDTRFRNDGFRPRGGFNGGHGYGGRNNEFRGRGGFFSGRDAERAAPAGAARFYQNGARSFRPAGTTSQVAVRA